MLSIWIGRAGSGKSARVLETIQRERENRPQLLLVPELLVLLPEPELPELLPVQILRQLLLLQLHMLHRLR
jgi:hypothetical protein